MAQSTILAEGSTSATSSDVSLSAGIIATVGIFSATGLTSHCRGHVYIDTPGVDQRIAELNTANPVVSICGPGTFRVVRNQTGGSFGVWSET